MKDCRQMKSCKVGYVVADLDMWWTGYCAQVLASPQDAPNRCKQVSVGTAACPQDKV